MARPFRIQFKGAFYHVMNRGRNKAKIFHRKADYLNFIKGIEEAFSQFDAKFHAFCIMPNHYHLFLETPEGNIARIMRHINGVYTQRYHRIYGSDGTLFKGRYKALLVDTDEYALDLVAYIHNNPINCTRPLVDSLEKYPWSSFNAYIKQAEEYDWLETEMVDSLYKNKSASNNHWAYVKEDFSNIFTEHENEARNPCIVGTKKFKASVLASCFNNDIEAAKKIYGAPSLKAVVASVANIYGEVPLKLRQKTLGRGRHSWPRKVAIYMCMHLTNSSLSSVKSYFNMSSERGVDKVADAVRQKFSRSAIDALSLKILREY